MCVGCTCVLKAARRPLRLRSGRTAAEVKAVGRPLERETVGIPLRLRSGRTTAEVEAVGRPLKREKVGKPLRREAVG